MTTYYFVELGEEALASESLLFPKLATLLRQSNPKKTSMHLPLSHSVGPATLKIE